LIIIRSLKEVCANTSFLDILTRIARCMLRQMIQFMILPQSSASRRNRAVFGKNIMQVGGVVKVTRAVAAALFHTVKSGTQM